MVVPLLAMYRLLQSLSLESDFRFRVSTVSFRPPSLTSISTPIDRMASIITSVSSLRKAPVIDDTLSLNAAQINARLVRLLLPGGRMDPETGPPGMTSTTGSIVEEAGGDWVIEKLGKKQSSKSD